MFIVEVIESIGKPPLRIPASQVVVRMRDGTPVSVAALFGSATSVMVSHCEDANFNDNLLSDIGFWLPLNQVGNELYINCTFSTIPLAVSCFVAIHNTVLSLLNNIVHKAKPADSVEIPNCLDLFIMLNLLALKSFKTSS